MSTPLHLSWENFRSSILVDDRQGVHRISSNPMFDLFSDSDRRRSGFWVECDPELSIPPELMKLSSISVRKVTLETRPALEVATSRGALDRQFYYFAIAVAERVIVERISGLDALILELHSFIDLFEKSSGLTLEQQIGLLGELIFLKRLGEKYGTAALDAWLGPTGEPHDFRLGDREFEIKSTVTSKRIHTISSLEQISPSLGRSLYVVSVLLGPPGSATGFTLPDTVTALIDGYTSSPRLSEQFGRVLSASGYQHSDSVKYDRSYVLRRPLAIVPVDSQFPAITRVAVQSLLGPAAARIDSVRYAVNLDGLEHVDGSELFEGAVSV